MLRGISRGDGETKRRCFAEKLKLHSYTTKRAWDGKRGMGGGGGGEQERKRERESGEEREKGEEGDSDGQECEGESGGGGGGVYQHLQGKERVKK